MMDSWGSRKKSFQNLFKEKEKKMKKNHLFVLKISAVLFLIIFGLGRTGIAANPSRYSTDMQYNSAQAVIPEHSKADEKTRGVMITIAEFTDIRKVDDKKMIGWVKELDGTKVPLFPKNDPPTQVVASGIRDYLKKAGYKVVDKMAQWDLTEETLSKAGGKVIIGGSIEEMDVTCWTGVFSNDYKVNMKLNLVVADAARGKILHKSNVTIAFSKTDVSFSEGQLGKHASLALGDAIEKLFEGKTVTQKIKEAAIQNRQR